MFEKWIFYLLGGVECPYTTLEVLCLPQNRVRDRVSSVRNFQSKGGIFVTIPKPGQVLDSTMLIFEVQ